MRKKAILSLILLYLIIAFNGCGKDEQLPTLPNVVDLSADKAQDTLKEAGYENFALLPDESCDSSMVLDSSNWIVKSQDPEAESEAKFETKVTLYCIKKAESVDKSTLSNRNDFNIDINKCIQDLKEGLTLDPDYTFVKDYAIQVDGKDLTISIVVDDATDPERALDFADTVVRQLNLYANMQDSDIELGNKDFYGGLYTEYSALVGVAPYSKTNNPDEWFVYDAIVGGKTMLNLK